MKAKTQIGETRVRLCARSWGATPGHLIASEFRAKAQGRSSRHKKIDATKGRKLEGIKVLGVSWPTWLFKDTFDKRKKPPKASRFVWDGEVGLLVPSKYGNPDGTSQVRTRVVQGAKLRTNLADANEMHNPGEIDDLFNRIDKSQKVVSRKRGRVDKPIKMAPTI